MKLHSTALKDLIVVETLEQSDLRGSFARLYCSQELTGIVGHRHITQINQSRTITRGSVRGLHFQHPPHAEMKFVRCIKGRIWDVAVDLRETSKTFLQWHAEELTPNNSKMLVIPEGFAHGFQALEPESEILYLHTNLYTPSSEGGLNCNDPYLNISWPLKITKITDRDANYPLITKNYSGIKL
jgi:dTDP-4-dehydrorhamnose 3,5-epimerase